MANCQSKLLCQSVRRSMLRVFRPTSFFFLSRRRRLSHSNGGRRWGWAGDQTARAIWREGDENTSKHAGQKDAREKAAQRRHYITAKTFDWYFAISNAMKVGGWGVGRGWRELKDGRKSNGCDASSTKRENKWGSRRVKKLRFALITIYNSRIFSYY